MKNKETNVTLKTEVSCIQNHPEIIKIIATINAKNIAKLLNVVGLTANPRKSKKNKVTNAICETLRIAPHDLRFKSKGLLISTMSCQILQRGRYKISFDDPTYEGVLDGGHNMLAIGIYILEEFFGDESHTELRKIKKWDDFLKVWNKYSDELDEILQAFEFEVPIEIIYPAENYQNNFVDRVLDISDARNNNSPLTAGTKADHRGYYEHIKQSLDPNINDKVAWKDGDADKYIKRDDIVSMALIPFIALQEAGKLDKEIPNINPAILYSSKGKCVDLFSKIYEKYSDEKGIIDNIYILSALKLLKDLPRLYDLIYKDFPDSARKNGLSFGRMGCVKLYEKGRTGDSYLKPPPLTKYYKEKCNAKYPDGFILPVFAALFALMKVEDGEVKWATNDPVAFLEKNLTSCIKMLVSNIKDNAYNPQNVGKSTGSYEGMKLHYQVQLMMDK